jgi:hypothetical protein
MDVALKRQALPIVDRPGDAVSWSRWQGDWSELQAGNGKKQSCGMVPLHMAP